MSNVFRPGRRPLSSTGHSPEKYVGSAPSDPGGIECPITFLGQRAGTYYFLSPCGELRQLGCHQLTGHGIVSLFDGYLEWLEEYFPPTDREAKSVGFNTARAAQWLIQQSREAGIYNPLTCVRGPGVWADEAFGALAHCGDALIYVDNGVWQRCAPGRVRDDIVYAAAPKLPAPALEGATTAEVGKLRDGLAAWRYELGELGPDIVLGWIGSALLGGSTDWRIHIMLKGGRGRGKSALTKFVTHALGAAAHPDYNDFSEAGLRQSMTGEARAIMLDESECEERGASHVAAVITLIRRMSSGDGARTVRGSASHAAHSFSVTGSAWLSAILQPPLKPQDRSRIVELYLEPLPLGDEGASGADNVKALYRFAQQLSPKLRARAILGWERHRETVALYRRAFLEAGLDIRESDKAAAILAGRDLLLYDVVPDTDSLLAAVRKFRPLIAAARADEDESEGQECLTHLFSSPMDVYRGGERPTVGQVLMAAMGHPDDGLPESTAQRALACIGIKVVMLEAGAVLKIANKHVGLARLFAGSRWEEGKWRDALHYLPGALAGGRESFAGAQVRCTQLNESFLPGTPLGRAGDPRDSEVR